MTTPNPHPPIRVLLVDDSALTLALIKRSLASEADIQVVGTAENGLKALEMIPALNPDVICSDLHMPVMDGLEFTRAVMEKFPRPVLILSVSVQKEQHHNIFQSLEVGALDVLAKPRAMLEGDGKWHAEELISKIRILSGVMVLRKKQTVSIPSVVTPELPTLKAPKPRIIGIGSSTGGPQALKQILSHLPGDFQLPIVCVQHISEGFLPGLMDWLAGQCCLPIQMAATGIEPQAGIVYFAPEGMHLTIAQNGTCLCSKEPGTYAHRPSISVTFASLAQHFGTQAVGVLLSGMGRDGADGMAAIKQAGGLTIAQDESSSVVYGMAREAVALGAAQYVLPLEQIAPALAALAENRNGMSTTSRLKETT